MVKQQGIDVYLAPFGKIDQRYPEHPSPTGPTSTTPNNKEVYIEAVDGERFLLVVDLTNDFDAKGSPILNVSYGLDSTREFTGRWNMIGTYTYKELREDASSMADLKGRRVVPWQKKTIGGQWVECGFAFSPLSMGNSPLLYFRRSVRILTLADEDLDMDPYQVSKHVEGHGKIIVSISRGKSIATAKGVGQPLADWYAPSDALVSSKAVVKDNHVSHVVK